MNKLTTREQVLSFVDGRLRVLRIMIEQWLKVAPGRFVFCSPLTSLTPSKHHKFVAPFDAQALVHMMWVDSIKEVGPAGPCLFEVPHLEKPLPVMPPSKFAFSLENRHEATIQVVFVLFCEPVLEQGVSNEHPLGG